jgi:hypothetical protein
MPKRKGSKAFGGGTGDVNPQWFNMATVAATAGYLDVGTTLPRERLPYGNKSQVMEVLKVQFLLPTTKTFVLTAATAATLTAYLTTSSFQTTEPNGAAMTGKVVAKKRVDFYSTAAAPAQSGYAEPSFEAIIDLSDGAGNGVLIATDQVYVGTIQTGATNPLNGGNIGCRLFYRWKNVGLSEYIGIVQSQQ